MNTIKYEHQFWPLNHMLRVRIAEDRYKLPAYLPKPVAKALASSSLPTLAHKDLGVGATLGHYLVPIPIRVIGVSRLMPRL